MDAEQQAVLDSILGQSPGNATETAQATDPAETPDSGPPPSSMADAEAPQAAPQGSAPAAPAAPAAPKKSRHDELMERLMGNARQTREEQLKQQEMEQLRRDAAEAQKLRELAKLHPEAALKALGVEQKKKEFDFESLFGDKEESLQDKSVKQLEARIAKLDEYIKSQEKTREEEKQTILQQQQSQWAEQEVQRITSFIDSSKDKFEYLAAAREMGSDKDLYNGMISLYNQGYQPTYEDMADLVEARIEKLLDLVGPTSKFKSYMKERYGVQLTPKEAAESKTLTGGLGGDSPALADIASLPDDEQQKLALKAAHDARDRARKALGLKT